MVRTPTVRSSAVSTGAKESPEARAWKEQGQLSEDSEVPRREETFLRCTFPVASGFCRVFGWLSSPHTPTLLSPTEGLGR